jgi:hypothetical protein
VPPAVCPVCGGPAWRVCGAWYCERCASLAPTRADAELVPIRDEREAVRQLAAAAGFPCTPLSPGVSVLPGKGWQRFIRMASADELAAARVALGGVPTPGRGT